MGLNLNNDEASRLAEHGTLADRLLQIGHTCAPPRKEPFLSVAHGDLLYDERGLPN
jgi:antitoxin VapB